MSQITNYLNVYFFKDRNDIGLFVLYTELSIFCLMMFSHMKDY